jgi:hypothetical protein
MSDSDEMVVLKNGKAAPRSLINTVHLALVHLASNGSVPDALAAISLADFCRNGVAISGRELTILTEMTLVESDGSVHDTIKDIVLSATVGSSFNLRVVNPIEGQ